MENPVFYKELKTKMRSRQPLPVQMAIGGLVGLFVLYCYYQAVVFMTRFGGQRAGDDAFVIAVYLQAILIWLLSPALTANAISQEKEQQTWEMLIFTLLSPREILLGKLCARIIPMLALLAAFFPFMLFCYVRSVQIGLSDLLWMYCVFLVWVLFLATTGLFMSWVFRKTASAIAMSYLVIMALLIGTALVNMTLTISHWEETWLMWLNPVRITDALTRLHTDLDARGVLTLSSATFLGLSVLFLARMTARFRAFSIE